MLTAQDLIDRLGLQRLPVEGILFRQTYRATDTIADVAASERYAPDKPAGTCILAMFTDDPDSFSVMHRLISDEIWHFYLGDPVEMLLLHPGGRSERATLGHDIAGGQRVQFVVPRGAWMGARLVPGGKWALFGNTMAPGFTSADFEAAEREALIAQYPAEAELITRLTQAGGETRMPAGY